MNLGPNGEALIKNSESPGGVPNLQAYQDVVGVWTNGWGNTHGVVPHSTITLAQAQSDFVANTAFSVNCVNTLVHSPVNQNQFDALVDFVFNLGAGNFQNSTLLRLVNQGDFVGAARQFPLWNHAGGKVVAGLTTRRLAEQTLFSDPVPPVTNLQPTLPSVPSGVDSVTQAVNDVTSFLQNLQSKLP